MAVPTSAKGGYHHGDLRAALLETAVQMLERGENFSMRAVARRAGVSPTAPYRHFADRGALESAVAVEGFRDLKAALMEGRDLPSSEFDLAEFAVAYVAFALRRPAVFRLMFGNACDDTNDQRVKAAAALHELLTSAMVNVFPGADAPTLAMALWSLAHGLAFLHLDGKFAATSAEDVAARVRSSFETILSVHQASGPQAGDAERDDPTPRG